MDSADIYKLLKNTYCCSVKKVGTHKDIIEVERKRKIGVKKKILGIFPIYEYERWTDTLSDWTYERIKYRNRFTGRESSGFAIAICYDKIDNVCYWKYA